MARWYKEEMQLPFYDRLPEGFKELLQEAEEYDRQDRYGAYFNDVDAIDDGAKMLCEKGIISEYEWNQIMLKYQT